MSNSWVDPNPNVTYNSNAYWADFDAWEAGTTHCAGSSVPQIALPIGGGVGLPADFSVAGTPAYTTDFNALKSQLKTPGQIVNYIDQNFTWVDNTTNRLIYAPSTTDNLKTGMCADFAAFDAFFLNNDGYNANILHYTGVDSTGTTQSHWITEFQDQGQNWIISNGSLVGPVTDSNLQSTLATCLNVSQSSVNVVATYPYNGTSQYFAAQS